MADTTLNIVLKGDAHTGHQHNGGSSTMMSLGESSSGITGQVAKGAFIGSLAATAVISVISILKTGYDAVVAKVKDSIDQLTKYSGAVATAVGQAEIRRIQVQLNRDARIGQDIAKFVTNQSRIEVALEGIWTSIMRAILPLVEAVSSILAAFLERFNQVITEDLESIRKILIDGIEMIRKVLAYLGDIPWLPDALHNFFRENSEALLRDKDAKGANYLNAFVNNINRWSMPGPPANPNHRNLGGTQPVFF
jgi:hypothetical protein